MKEAIIICWREKFDKPQNQTVLILLSVFFVPLFGESGYSLLTLGSEVVAGRQVGVVAYLHRVEAEILFRGICEGDHRLEGQPATKTKRHMYDSSRYSICLLVTFRLLAALKHSSGCGTCSVSTERGDIAGLRKRIILKHFIRTISLLTGANHRQKEAHQFDWNWNSVLIADSISGQCKKLTSDQISFVACMYDIIIYYIESDHTIKNCIFSCNTL